MRDMDSVSVLEVVWLSEASPLRIASERYEQLRVRGRAVVLRDWVGGDKTLVDHDDLFGAGPARALVLWNPEQLATVLVVGEEGSELLELDLEMAEWSPVADLPRFPNDVGGMCRLDVLPQAGVTLLHWELGILAVGPSLELLWQHDLGWNHSLTSLGDDEVWFDLMYESDDVPQRIGDAPWAYSLADGRELFGDN